MFFTSVILLEFHTHLLKILIGKSLVYQISSQNLYLPVFKTSTFMETANQNIKWGMISITFHILPNKKACLFYLFIVSPTHFFSSSLHYCPFIHPPESHRSKVSKTQTWSYCILAQNSIAYYIKFKLLSMPGALVPWLLPT